MHPMQSRDTRKPVLPNFLFVLAREDYSVVPDVDIGRFRRSRRIDVPAARGFISEDI
jgi:hypothetical protein